jgi:predicted ester cyclase
MADTKAVSDAYTDAFNAHDEQGIRACFADGATFTAPGGVSLQGADAITEYNMGWLRAFPDAKVTVTNEVIAGEWAMTQGEYNGTHTETLSSPEGDIPATGKSVTGRAAEFIRVVDGKIVEDHLYFDNMEILTQLGLVPEGAATA